MSAVPSLGNMDPTSAPTLEHMFSEIMDRQVESDARNTSRMDVLQAAIDAQAASNLNASAPRIAAPMALGRLSGSPSQTVSGGGAASATCVSSQPCAGRGSVGRFGSASQLARILFLVMALDFLGITIGAPSPLPPPLSPLLPPAQPPRPAQPGWHVERHGRRRYPPHGTMDRILSRTATRRRSDPQTAWRQGGWAAL